MKKYLLLFILPLLLILNACKKMDGVVISKTGTSTNSGSSSGGTTGGTTTTGDTYQPVTKNSYWKYTATTGTMVSHSVNTINGATATFNSKLYYSADATSDQYTGTQTGYYYIGNHVYSIRSTTLVYGITVDMIYLNDALAVGAGWTAKITDDGLVNGVPGQIVGTIVETGISKTVSGKAFTNVIHSKVVLQYNYGLGGGFENAATYDFYVAKNIGVIESDANITTFGFTLLSTSILSDYAIK